MSDTPRTDAEAGVLDEDGYWLPRETGFYVDADFARQLERENAALRSLLREAITDHVSEYDLPESEDYIARVKAALGEDKP